jgi:hypothetical protein
MCKNNKIFKNTTPTVQICSAFKLKISSLLWRAKRKILLLLQEWRRYRRHR